MGLDFELILAELHEFRKELASTKEVVSSTARLLHADQGHATVKALVWFWWIDETLSANLAYQSDYEIGSTF